MSLVPFDDLPPESRLWCFGASRPLTGDDRDRVEASMRSFLAEWTAHRRNLHAGFTLSQDRFLLIAVDESRAGASGCSIDGLSRHLRELGEELGVELLDSTPVWFRDLEGRIESTSRAGFLELARRGRVGPTTPVFDLTIPSVEDFRRGRLERAADAAWHRALLTRV
jgi:hypothetical protein